MLVPVIVTWMIEAAAKVQDSVELPEPGTLVGVTLHDVLLVPMLTTPANPLRGLIVTIEVLGDPASTTTAVGLTVTVKS